MCVCAVDLQRKKRYLEVDGINAIFVLAGASWAIMRRSLIQYIDFLLSLILY